MAWQISYNQNHFSKWLLAVSILFSSLTFSGYIDDLPPQPEETTQTEQLLSGNDGSKRIVSFQNASKFSQTQKTLTLCIKGQSLALLFHNEVYARQYKTTSKNTLTFDLAKRFIQSINFHKNSKEETNSSLLG